MNVLGTLMNLLIHENTDVALAALNLLSELLDEDAVSDNTDDAKILVDGMVCVFYIYKKIRVYCHSPWVKCNATSIISLAFCHNQRGFNCRVLEIQTQDLL
jgi:hypothetical protein